MFGRKRRRRQQQQQDADAFVERMAEIRGDITPPGPDRLPELELRQAIAESKAAEQAAEQADNAAHT